MIRFILSSILIFYISVCWSQSPNYKVTNYTVESGLPSNECHRILQDNMGYVWIATDRGLVRFDGYDFKVYGLKEGLTNPSVLELFYSATENKLFMLSFGSEVFEMDLASEEISVFACQEIIENYSPRFRIAEMHLSESGDFYADLDGYGVLKINQYCEGEILEIETNDNIAYVGVIKIDSSSVITFNKNKATSSYKLLDYQRYETANDIRGHGRLLYKGLNYKFNRVEDAPLTSQARSFQINDSILLCSVIGFDIFIKDEKVIEVNNEFQIRDVIKLNSGEFIVLRGDLGGAELYKDLDGLLNQRKQSIIQNLSPTCVFEDKYGNIWITTLDEGFFKLSNKKFKNVLKDKSDIDATDVIVQDGNIIFIEGREKIFTTKNAAREAIFVSEYKELADIQILDKNTFAVANRGSFVMNEKNELSFIKTPSMVYDYVYNVLANKIRIFDDRKFWLSSSNFGFHKDFQKLPEFVSTNHLNLHNYRVLDVEKVKQDLYLLGRKDGLYYFNDSIPEKVISDRPELNVRINSIVKNDQWYFLATQGYGLVIWDLKDQLFSIKTDDGLCTDNTEEIYLQDEFIYVLSKVGLSQLKGDPINGYEIRCLNSKHGLPSNQINGLAERNDSLIIATNKGLVIFDQEIEQSDKTAPIFEHVSANDNWISKDTSLHHSFNNIKYQFKTLDYALSGEINYRYKLNSQDWNYTKSTTVDFPDLNPGFYSFQVQSQNIDGVWGDSEIFEFSIKKPWWEWLIIRVLLFILLAILGYQIYQRRLRTIRKDFQIEKEIRDLEKSALAAQMNPHFIFNCLNSIQNFVMNNEKESAMEYLGKFAQLIRGNLNASSESLLTLNDEIKMLGNYLELEQLRLNNSFDFEIECDRSINTSEIEIPPMLIQPFAENAVVHGMKSVKEGGVIKISFQKMKEHLQVRVFDNGSIDNSINLDKTNKSYGTKITQKRLAFINKMSEEDITVTPYSTEKGTEVQISIRLNA